ncbi:putative Zn(II)2Cys6 transcription factor [Ilyonectria robusta]
MPRDNSPTHAETGEPLSLEVRCDRTIPSCRKCHRLGVTCPGYELDHGSISRSEMLKSTNDIFKAAGIEKRRVGSCHECRASKSRCTRTKPACQRCVAKCLKCVYHSKAGDQDDSSASPSDHIHLLERDQLLPGLDAR